MSRTKLAVNALTKYVAGAALMGAPLFLSAGTLHYRGAWLLLGLLMIPMLILGIGLLILSPELLERRLNSKEKRKKQSGVVRLSGLSFIVGFVVAGLDHRFGWSAAPSELVIGSSALLLLSYLGYMEVMRENIWLLRTIEVAENQKVIDTGLYSVVRHPMYLFTLLLFLSMPLVLGSIWALIPFAINIPVIVIRTLDEERLLKAELEGYTDYCNRVKWRILPLIW
ncbi:MAG: isoprenylcysteine carboxylmethyltransferase family protein [Alistipes sp.]|nr:isoprenylcysteine carboxylmethyltransferase family protein [Alistipes sp.]